MLKRQCNIYKGKIRTYSKWCKFDANKYKTDSKYDVQWDRQLIIKVLEIGTEELRAKFGDSDYADIELKI